MSLRLLISAFLGFWEVFSHSFQPTVTNGHLLTAPPFINNIYLYSLENILSKVFFFPQRYQNILNYCKMSIWVENQAKNVTHLSSQIPHNPGNAGQFSSFNIQFGVANNFFGTTSHNVLQKSLPKTPTKTNLKLIYLIRPP